MAQVELDRAAGRDGNLPPVCMYCGEPAVAKRQKVFTGTTPITMFMGAGIPRVKMPVCGRHGWPFALRHKLALLLFGAATVVILFLLSRIDAKPAPPAWIAPLAPWKGTLILWLFGFFVCTVVAHCIAFYTDIRCVWLSRDVIALKNVSDAFVDACYGHERPIEPAAVEDVDEIVELESTDSTLAAQSVSPSSVPPVRAVARPSADRGKPRSRAWTCGIAVITALMLLACCGGPALLWTLAVGSDPVRLTNARLTQQWGLATSIAVDYRFNQSPDPDVRYVLVVESEGRRAAQLVFSTHELQQSGTKRLDVLRGGPFGAAEEGSDVTLFVEAIDPVSNSTRRVSNIVTAR